jgi:serine/threonine-protein kinase
MNRPRRLASQIFAASAVVVAGSLILVWILTSWRASGIADRNMAAQLQATRAAVEDVLTQRTASMQRLAAGLAGVPAYYSRFEGAVEQRSLSTLLDQAEEFRDQLGAAWTMLLDANGTMLAWTLHPERSNEDFTGGALVDGPLAGEPTTGTWLEPMGDGDLPYQGVAVPLRAPGGSGVRGILIAALGIDSTLADQLRLQTRAEVAIATLDTLGKARLVATTLAIGAPVLTAAIDTRAADGRVELAEGGEGYIGAASPLVTAAGDTVGVVVGLGSRRLAMATNDPLRGATFLGFLVGLGLALGTGLWLSRRIAAPLRTLVRATRAAREGDYSVTLPAHAPQEISELARAFHGLMDDLKAKEELVAVLHRERNTRAVIAPSPDRLENGALFANRYEIRGLLGAGGMGTVYRAIDRELGEAVAVKTLTGAALEEGGAALDRFREEIRLARRISHRNVVRTHDLGVSGANYYLTMELVDGRSLEDVLAQEGTLSPGAVQSIAIQALRALDAAHAVGVVHRDIKPPNLLLDGSGLLKVTDFGIARLADANGRGGKLTATGMVVGTPAYMAPEQLSGEVVDARADLYALGAVLYECLTGKSPHEGLGLMQLFARAQQATPAPDPRAQRPETPTGLAEVIRTALSPQPAGRFANAQAMLEALEATGSGNYP